MSLLAILRAKKQKREVATLTVATDATHEDRQAPTVASVATVTVATFEKTLWAANDPATPAPATDPDRWCWPHSTAIDTAEVDTFTARLARFTEKGASMSEAQALAEKLVRRDREQDGRRLCLECAHLQGTGRWRCGNAERAEVSKQGLARDLVLLLQQCPGFKEVRP